MIWILIKRRLGSQCPDYIFTSFIFYAFLHNLWKVFIHIFSLFHSSVMNSPPWNADSNVKWFKLHPSPHFTTWLNAAFVLFQMKSVWVCTRACVRVYLMTMHAFARITSPWTSKDKQWARWLQAHACLILRTLQWPFTSIWFPILYIPNITLRSLHVWDGPLCLQKSFFFSE